MIAAGLHWLPPLGAAGCAMLVGCALFAASYSALRDRAPLALLARLLAIFAIGAALLGPSSVAPAPAEPAPPSVLLLVDRSLSMCTPDVELGAETLTRAEALAAAWLAPDFLERLAHAADLRLFAFDHDLAAATAPELTRASPTGESTRLAHALRSALSAAPRAAHVVLLTDGADTEDTGAGALAALGARARAAGVRLSAVVPGRDGAPPDARIHASFDDSVVFAGQNATLRVHVRQSGCDGWPARLVVRDDDADGAVVGERMISLGPPQDVSFTLRPGPGPGPGPRPGAPPLSLAAYTVTLEPLAGEADAANNTAPAFVHVSGERIRIALFENEPYWDTKYFTAAMRADPQVELVSITGLGRREQVIRFTPGAAPADAPPAPPLDEASLFAFDIVVLGRGVERWFGDAERANLLRRFVVERGGSLIFLRGPATTDRTPAAGALQSALADIAPVDWGLGVVAGGALEATAAGVRDGVFDSSAGFAPVLSDLPGMLASTRIEGEKALAVVWLREAPAGGHAAPGAAAVAHMPAGRGRTLAVLTDGLWRWAFLPAPLSDRATVYRLFWARAVRWLALGAEFAPGQSMSLAVDRPMVRPGEPVEIIVRTRYFDPTAPAPSLTVRAPSGAAVALRPARADETSSAFRAVFIPDEHGVHHVSAAGDPAPGLPRAADGALATRFAVREDRAELLDTAPRPAPLRAAAERSGGRLLSLERPGELLDMLDAAAAASLAERRPEPAWDRVWLFAFITLALGFEWLHRRWRGLP